MTVTTSVATYLILWWVVLFAVLYFNFTTLVLVNFLTLVIGAGLVMYLFSFYYSKIFEQYIRAEEPVTPEELAEGADGASAKEPAGIADAAPVEESDSAGAKQEIPDRALDPETENAKDSLTGA